MSVLTQGGVHDNEQHEIDLWWQRGQETQRTLSRSIIPRHCKVMFSGTRRATLAFGILSRVSSDTRSFAALSKFHDYGAPVPLGDGREKSKDVGTLPSWASRRRSCRVLFLVLLGRCSGFDSFWVSD